MKSSLWIPMPTGFDRLMVFAPLQVKLYKSDNLDNPINSVSLGQSLFFHFPPLERDGEVRSQLALPTIKGTCAAPICGALWCSASWGWILVSVSGSRDLWVHLCYQSFFFLSDHTVTNSRKNPAIDTPIQHNQTENPAFSSSIFSRGPKYFGGIIPKLYVYKYIKFFHLLQYLSD